MANLRCSECGRYVNDPADHSEECPLYKKRDVYVGDETPNSEA